MLFDTNGDLVFTVTNTLSSITHQNMQADYTDL